MSSQSPLRKIIIVGSGPAGLTAAIYSARGGLKPLIIEGFQSGGQLMLTTEVENFPGFEHGVMGPELMKNMRAQALRFGAEFISADATQVDLSGAVKKVWVEKELHESKTVILSTGASANLLGLANESRLMGKGVSTCATCDGFFFKNRVIGVVGGGDSAMEEANYLSRFGSKVYLIHRRSEFKASKIMVERAKANPKIEFVTDVVVEDVLGENEVKGVSLSNLKTGKKTTLDLEGLFVAIGHTPNSQLFKNQVRCDEKGYVLTNPSKSGSSETNLPGVFACGDLQDSRYRQAITAAGSGCMASLDAEHFLLNH